jgi:translation initiation factor 2 beta subunit (eIF-2beta)/eIF-5
METRAEQIEAELTVRVEEIEQRVSELEEKFNEELNEIQNISDPEIVQEIESTIEPLLVKINQLGEDLEEDVESYQRIEMLKQLEEYLEEGLAHINEVL